MKSQTISANYLKTICWQDNTIVDWVSSGKQYLLNGEVKQLGKYSYGFSFDSSIVSENGEYILIYQNLGTKGLLLKNGELLREINRSYYCSDVYEFPAVFLTIENKTYLIHCPIAYNQLDFEDVETGELITNTKGREPNDIFHSRLEISPNKTYLMSKGWVWHPLDQVHVFNIEECINAPKLLDDNSLYPNVGVEISTASFINDSEVLIGSSDEVLNEEEIENLPPKHIAIWNLKTNHISKPIKVKEDFGNLFPINEHLTWDLFGFPKVVNINTGDIIEENKEINTGQQRSSIIHHINYPPSIAFNRETKQIAIKGNEEIEILTPLM